MEKIILLEDDKNLGESLKLFFETEGYLVTWVSSVTEFNKEFSFEGINTLRESGESGHQLAIFDWRLSDGQGVDVLKNIRDRGITIPVIMLTAKSDLLDKIIGLESGASDYVTKPFEPKELLARVRSQLRGQLVKKGVDSTALEDQKEKVRINDLLIDRLARIVYFNDKVLELTKLEYDLLVLLSSEPNRVFSRDELLNKVWGYEGFPTTRTIDTHILQLRQKTKVEYFETIRGVGYRFKEEKLGNKKHEK